MTDSPINQGNTAQRPEDASGESPARSRSFLVPASVVHRLIQDDVLLLNLDTGVYFGLSGVGTLVWESLRKGRSASEIVELVLAEYEVERHEAEADVNALLQNLLGKGLIVAGGLPG